LPNHAGHFGGQHRDHGSESCATRKAGWWPFLNPGRYGLSASAERRPGAFSHTRHAGGSCRTDARPGHRSAHLQRRESCCGPGRTSSICSAGARHACFSANLANAGRVSARASINIFAGGRHRASSAHSVIQKQRRLPPHRPLLLQNLRQVGKALQSTVESSASANPVKDEGVFLLWRFLPHRCARA